MHRRRPLLRKRRGALWLVHVQLLRRLVALRHVARLLLGLLLRVGRRRDLATVMLLSVVLWGLLVVVEIVLLVGSILSEFLMVALLLRTHAKLILLIMTAIGCDLHAVAPRGVLAGRVGTILSGVAC